MQQIQTTVPIAIENLKRKFNEDVEFVIDCAASKFKGKMLITYLSNLDIKCRLQLTNKQEALDLVVAYLNSATVINLYDLENVVINILLARQGKPNFSALIGEELDKFCVDNEEIINTWMKRINALPLYAPYCMADREDTINEDLEVETTLIRNNRDYVESFPLDENDSLVGINYVNLISHPQFVVLLEGVTEKDYTFNPALFNEYLFGGKNLFHFFAVKENPIFVLLVASQSKELLGELSDQVQLLQEQTAASVKELKHVPSN